MKTEQNPILLFREWYLEAVDTIRDMEANGPSTETEEILAEVRRAVAEAGREAVNGLGR